LKYKPLIKIDLVKGYGSIQEALDSKTLLASLYKKKLLKTKV